MKDLIFECIECGCLWQRSYLTNSDGSLPSNPERYSLVDGQVAKACCDNAPDFKQKTRIKITGEVDPRVHAGEPTYGGRTSFGWTSDGGCSYCGSLSVPEAIRLLRTPGSQFSGTDKTGYKAYIGDRQKFYFRHLRASLDAEFAEFDALSRKVFGLAWSRDAKGDLMVRYPRSGGLYGWQTFGHIGDDGEPVFHDGSPKAPAPEWWNKTMGEPE